MNPLSWIARVILSLTLVAASFLVSAQDQYVKTIDLTASSGNEGKTYHYTQSVTLSPPFVANGANGEFLVTPIPINPPPSMGQNFVRVEVPRIAISSEKTLSLAEVESKSTTYDYVDGLGREVQQVKVQGSYSKLDIIQPMVYDDYGRQPIEYLPYTNGSTGAFRSNAVTQQSSFYTSASKIDHDTRPFTEHTFDNSPLNRVLSSYLPGNQWKADSKNVVNTFEVNVANEVRKWSINGSGHPASTSYYAANQLLVEQVEGEDEQITKEYTNGRGELILSRVKKDNSTNYDTYYIYDDFGNLRFVIPPKLVALDVTPGGTLVRALAFEYRYDERQRVIAKYLPGARNTTVANAGEPIYIVYDQWDRQVMTQDGVQRSKSPSEWTYTKYDNFNRPIITGIYASNLSRDELQDDVNSDNDRFETTASGEVGYTLNQTYPINPDVDKILTITYYDDYSFKDASWNPLDFSPQSGFDAGYHNNIKGQVTGNKIRGIGTSWLKSAVYYNEKYREIQSVTENHLDGVDRTSTVYDHIGNITKTKTNHSSEFESSVTVLKEFEYDHANRLLTEFNTIDNGPRVLLVSNEYNELGEIVERNLHSTNNGSSFLQSVDQRYNVRGWLTDINHHKLSNDGGATNDDSNDLFGMRLSYNQDQYTVNGNSLNKQYSGNIAGVKWSADNLVDPVDEQGYSYDYDLTNRLTTATYGKNTGSDTNFGGTAFYSMNATYDENGNIMTLNRSGIKDGALIPMDNLVYEYENSNQGNLLYRVTDNGDDNEGFKDTGEPGRIFWHDANGNLVADNYKEITGIQYNYLNLPTYITFDDGKTIQYDYDGTGAKIRKTVTDGGEPSISDYLRLGQYANQELEFIFTSAGRALKHVNEFNYEYFLKDHLGNTRVTFGNLPERSEVVANQEVSNQAFEENEFTYPLNTIRTTDHNKTPLGGRSLVLNGGLNAALGPMKVLDIANGDVVEIEAWAKYEGGGWNSSSVTGIIQLLEDAFENIVTGGAAENAISEFSSELNAGSAGIFSGNSAGQPQAYLQYIFFDESGQYLRSITEGVASWIVSDFKSVGVASDGQFAKLSSGKLTFNQPGHLLVYIVNETNQNKDVYFDDLKIVQETSATSLKVSQAQDYYPFGGSFNEYSYGLNENKYLYNGMEKQEETGWYDFGARMYDHYIGRWNHIDPKAASLSSVSPYNYALNNPLSFIDPDGEFPIKITVRSFAPYDWFGMRGWMGDNRGFSTSSYVTSRLTTTSSFDTDFPSKSFSSFATGSNSIGRHLGAQLVIARSEARFENFSNGNNLNYHLYGNDDAIVPSFDNINIGGYNLDNLQSPNINVHLDLLVNTSEPDSEGFQMMEISGELIGDGFPAAEAYVTDANGNSIFIGVGQAMFGPTEGPFLALWGDTKRQNYQLQVKVLTKDGVFYGVEVDGKIIGINEWNQRFTEMDTQSDIQSDNSFNSPMNRFGETFNNGNGGTSNSGSDGN